VWPSLYTPIGTLKYEKLNYRITRFSTLMDELLSQNFSGYVEILAPHEHGLILLYNGRVHNCFYEGTEDLNLSREDIIRHFLRTETRERETIINVGELNSRIIAALSALEPREPAHRELETVFLDLNKLFETLARKHFTGTLRFYRIRNNTRLGNILLRLKKITADQLREAIRLQLSGEGALRLGDALVQIGAIGKHDLEEALDRQTYTRKGSDFELALALFSEGEFLGGYRYAGKMMVTDRQEVISWVGTSEILMDIIDGLLPPAVDIQHILYAETTPQIEIKPEPEPVQPESEPLPAPESESKRKAGDEPKLSPSVKPSLETKKEALPTVREVNVTRERKEKTAVNDIMIRELTKETFMLKADDLILDIHPHPAAPPVQDLEEDSSESKSSSWLDELVSRSPKVDIPPATESTVSSGTQSPPVVSTESINQKSLETTDQPNLEHRAGHSPSSVQNKEVKSETEINAESVGSTKAGINTEPLTNMDSQSGAQFSSLPVREHTDESYDSATTFTSDQSEWLLTETMAPPVQGIDLMEQVLRTYMGFLGIALLERERRRFEIPVGKTLNLSQLKDINQRLFYSTSIIVGTKTAEKIMCEIEEKIGG